MAAPTPPPELLLHADFVRGLARALVGVDGDDVAQQAWLRALQAPPPRGDVRAFLAAIVRRLAWNQRRGERRRNAHESQTAAPEPTPTPEQVLAREEARRRVVDAVLALDEPFREVILLRFYEDLAPHAIADRLGVPPATVRTRLLRALARLRSRLDGERGGRTAWAAPLAPWLGSRASPAGLPALVIAMKQVIAVAAIAASLFVIALLVLYAPAPTPPAVAGERLTAAAVADAANADAGHSDPAAENAPDDARVRLRSPRAADAPYPADRRFATLRGFVVDDSGRAAAAVTVTVRPWLNPLPRGLQIADDRDYRFATTTDGSGAFAFAGVAEGPCEVRASAADGREGRTLTATNLGRDEAVWISLGGTPAEPDEVVVEVLDRDRRPQPGVRVEGCVLSADHGLCDGRERPERMVTTDERGLARFRGLRLQCGLFFARSDDGRLGMGSMAHDDELWLPITLDAPGSLSGRLIGADAGVLQGTRVILHQLSSTRPYGLAVGRSIAVEVHGNALSATGLAAGTYGVTLDSPAALRLQLEPLLQYRGAVPNSVVMRTVTVTAGETASLDLGVTRGGCLRGIVVDGDGRPVAGASVLAVLPPADPNFDPGCVRHGVHLWRLDWDGVAAPRDPQTHVPAATAADGRYLLRGLQPGRYRVEVSSSGLALDRRFEVPVADGETTELQHVLAPAGVLQVIGRGQWDVGVAPIGKPLHPRVIACVRGSIATIPGLPPGPWSVVGYGAGNHDVTRVFADVTITAGRTTWIDLRDRGDQTAIAGRVLAGGSPVAGVLVEIGPAMARTDAGGAFVLDPGFQVGPPGPVGWHFRVRSDGVLHSVLPPPESADRSPVDLHLGEHTLEVSALDAAGSPVAAMLDVYGEVPEAEAAHTVTSNGRIAVPPGGRRVEHLVAADYRVTATFASGAQVSTRCKVPSGGPLVLREPACGDVLVTVVADGRSIVHRKVDVGEWCKDGAPPPDPASFARAANWREAVTDAEGRARFCGVRSGDVLVCVDEDAATEQRIRVEPGVTARVTLHAR